MIYLGPLFNYIKNIITVYTILPPETRNKIRRFGLVRKVMSFLQRPRRNVKTRPVSHSQSEIVEMYEETD